jgi:hypothetical protein
VRFPGLKDGPHTVVIKAVDVAGNDAYAGESRARPLAWEWEVDTRTPIGLISTWTVHSTRRTPLTDAAFQFASDEPGSSFSCELDGQAGVCGDSIVPGVGAVAYTNLPHGKHTFKVLVTDPAGNKAPDESTPEFVWTVDLQGPVLQFATAPAGANYQLGDLSATKTWEAHFWSDEPTVGFECRFNSFGESDDSSQLVTNTTAAVAAATDCCYDAFGNSMIGCLASCRAAAAGGGRALSSGCFTFGEVGDAARREYSVCVVTQLRAAGPAMVPRTADWEPCENSFNATDLTHGRAYVLEVVATDDHGNTGSKEAPLLWFWGTNDMHVDRQTADVSAVRNAASIAQANCAKVSVVLIAVCLFAWFALLCLCGVIAYSKRYGNSSGETDALQKAHDQMSYQQALQMMGMDQKEDFFRVEIEPGYTDAYGGRWDQAADEIDTDQGAVRVRQIAGGGGITGSAPTPRRLSATSDNDGPERVTGFSSMSSLGSSVGRGGGGRASYDAQGDTEDAMGFGSSESDSD